MQGSEYDAVRGGVIFGMVFGTVLGEALYLLERLFLAQVGGGILDEGDDAFVDEVVFGEEEEVGSSGCVAGGDFAVDFFDAVGLLFFFFLCPKQRWPAPGRRNPP